MWVGGMVGEFDCGKMIDQIDDQREWILTTDSTNDTDF
jgi:hypothetical protein